MFSVARVSRIWELLLTERSLVRCDVWFWIVLLRADLLIAIFVDSHTLRSHYYCVLNKWVMFCSGYLEKWIWIQCLTASPSTIFTCGSKYSLDLGRWFPCYLVFISVGIWKWRSVRWSCRFWLCFSWELCSVSAEADRVVYTKIRFAAKGKVLVCWCG